MPLLVTRRPRLVFRTLARRSLMVAALALTGCGGDTVMVQVAIPDPNGIETPIRGVRLLMVPYDRDSLLAVLTARAPSPRPEAAPLDSLFEAFRAPFNAYLAAARRRETDSTAEAVAAERAAHAALARARVELMPRIDSLRTRITRWEDTAFAAYDSITSALARRGPAPVVDSTRADGWTSMAVPAKGWRLTARAPNPQDPNTEWYWNVPVTGDTIRLTAQTGRARPRFR